MKKSKLFRSQALKYYAQNRQKDILPYFISPLIFLLLWILFGMVFVAVVFVWQQHIPTSLNGSGIILTEQPASTASTLLFVPSGPPVGIKAGQPILLQVKVTGQQFTTKIVSVDAGTLVPDAAQAQYHLTDDALFAISKPSVVIHLHLTSQQATKMTNGRNVVRVQVQVGSRSLLSYLPDLLKGAFGG